MFDVLIPLIVGLPLAGFVVTALIGRRLDKDAHWIPVGFIVIVWAISMVVAFATLTHAEPFGEAGYRVSLYTWIPAGDFHVDRKSTRLNSSHSSPSRMPSSA